MTNLKISIFQFNPLVGDLAHNANALLSAISIAKSEGSNLFISSELAICGYSPGDLLLRADFYQKCWAQLERFLTISGITMIIGCPYKEGKNKFNSAFIIRDGKILGRYDKMLLPNYDVFDERRYFTPGKTPLVFKCNGINIGIVICEDMWAAKPISLAKKANAELICIINSSPFSLQKQQVRLKIAKKRVLENRIPLIYINQVGGQDELVFDGASFMLNKEAKITMQLPAFSEALSHIDFNEQVFSATKKLPGLINSYPNGNELLYKALVLATKDYVEKNGFKGVVLGLSGGIDSALTLAIAVDAIGRNRVMAIMMQSIYTADISMQDSREIVQNVGVKYEEIEINQIFNQFKNQLKPIFSGLKEDVTEENLQARIRGTLLMAVSNKLGYLVLTTGNKSEVATGYATLYGDMAGGFAPIKDVLKTQVYQLSIYRNTVSVVIPERIITRAPSAELRANQRDQDSLPDYAVLDQIITYLMEKLLSVEDIIKLGFKADEVRKIADLLKSSEYKRQQSAIGPKVSYVPFTKGWRYPITNAFKF